MSNQQSSTESPKFTITGNTITELAKQFAEVVHKTEQIEIVPAKKGGKNYGLWELGGGDGLALEAREFAFKDQGMPLFLGMSVVYRKLTPVAEYANAIVTAKAATIKRIDELKAQLERLNRMGK